MAESVGKGGIVRKAVLDVYVDVITEEEALHGLLVAPGEHVPFIGAGVSSEAGVPLANQICYDIRAQLERMNHETEPEAWARSYLNWDDAARRYATCLERYGSPEDRVNYFRSLLKGRRPAFAHQALALLMSRDKLHRNGLTTNFDKLLEQCFSEQNERECQAIRMREEAEFWGPEQDKCYLFKLHGDYDTHNILNTRDETRAIPDFFTDLAREILRARGLVALGSAGNEESINKFLEALLKSPEKRVLSRGVRWGVYVGPTKPASLSSAQSAELVTEALKSGALNRHLVELLSDRNTSERPCSFFPLWGSGRFLLRLIEAAGDPTLEYESRLLLDHDMRIASLFTSKGVKPSAIENHLTRLKVAQERISKAVTRPRESHRRLLEAAGSEGGRVRVVYGDISARTLLGEPSLPDRRAVLSADDTLISAGGGVALSLMNAAGPRFLLNETGKFAPIAHGTVAVTSAGSLPVHYLFHAAALDVDTEGEYHAEPEVVGSVMRDALTKAHALGVRTLFTPLISAGVAGLLPGDSLKAILQALDEVPDKDDRVVVIVIYDELILERDRVLESLRAHLREPTLVP